MTRFPSVQRHRPATPDLAGNLWQLSDLSGRRGFLQTVAGLGLSFALPPLTARAAGRRGTERPLSLITLWMQEAPASSKPGTLTRAP